MEMRFKGCIVIEGDQGKFLKPGIPYTFQQTFNDNGETRTFTSIVPYYRRKLRSGGVKIYFKCPSATPEELSHF